MAGETTCPKCGQSGVCTYCYAQAMNAAAHEMGQCPTCARVTAERDEARTARADWERIANVERAMAKSADAARAATEKLLAAERARREQAEAALRESEARCLSLFNELSAEKDRADDLALRMMSAALAPRASGEGQP